MTFITLLLEWDRDKIAENKGGNPLRAPAFHLYFHQFQGSADVFLSVMPHFFQNHMIYLIQLSKSYRKDRLLPQTNNKKALKILLIKKNIINKKKKVYEIFSSMSNCN